MVALGPTTASGNLTISGTGEFQLQGTYPRFIVQFEDGRDFDWNDVVMEVRIIPADCDPILKDPRVLPSLQQLMSQSKWDQPFAQRQEQGGYLVLDPTGNPGLMLFVVNSAGPCHIDRDWESQEQQLRGSGNTIIGALHTHPTNGGTVPFNPGNCLNPNEKGELVPIGGSNLDLQQGPSPFDYTMWKGSNDPRYAGYVIQPNGRVWRWEKDGSGKLRHIRFNLNDACPK